MGGGGGGGSTFRHRSPEELRGAVRKAEDDSSVKQFEVELAGTLSDLLGAYNSRDAQAVQERLSDIRAALQDEIEGTFDSLFGGSVAKHTYVDGLSDIDSLIEEARRAGANSLITTAKDAVKLRSLTVSLPCYVLEIEPQIENEDELVQLVLKAVNQH